MENSLFVLNEQGELILHQDFKEFFVFEAKEESVGYIIEQHIGLSLGGVTPEELQTVIDAAKDALVNIFLGYATEFQSLFGEDGEHLTIEQKAYEIVGCHEALTENAKEYQDKIMYLITELMSLGIELEQAINVPMELLSTLEETMILSHGNLVNVMETLRAATLLLDSATIKEGVA